MPGNLPTLGNDESRALGFWAWRALFLYVLLLPKMMKTGKLPLEIGFLASGRSLL
jgi:hypothetical protein